MTAFSRQEIKERRDRFIDYLALLSKYPGDDISASKIMTCCRFVASFLVTDHDIQSSHQLNQILSIVIGALVRMHADAQVDARLMAEEHLKCIVRAYMKSHSDRVLVELYKCVREAVDTPNDGRSRASSDRSSATTPPSTSSTTNPKKIHDRSINASLGMIGDMCHLLKPIKCRQFVTHLFLIIQGFIETGSEFLVLGVSRTMDPLCRSLLLYVSEEDIQALLRVVLARLAADSDQIRRAVSSIVYIICRYLPKPPLGYVFTVLLSNNAEHVFEQSRRLNVERGDNVSESEEPNCSSVIGSLYCILQMIGYTKDNNIPKILLADFVPNILSFVANCLHSSLVHYKLTLLEVNRFVPTRSLSTDVGGVSSLSNVVQAALEVLSKCILRFVDEFHAWLSDSDGAQALQHCVQRVCELALTDESNSSSKGVFGMVATRALVLQCVGLFGLVCPSILGSVYCKNKNRSESLAGLRQAVSKILKPVISHSDPALRGGAASAAVHLLAGILSHKTSFTNGDGNIDFEDTCLACMDLIIAGLEDASAVTQKSVCEVLGTVMLPLLSFGNDALIKCSFGIFRSLFCVIKSSYWLLRVKSFEVISSINFCILAEEERRSRCNNSLIGDKWDINGHNNFPLSMSVFQPLEWQGEMGHSDYQSRTLCVIFDAIVDLDSRVRAAAAATLVTILPTLQFSSALHLQNETFISPSDMFNHSIPFSAISNVSPQLSAILSKSMGENQYFSDSVHTAHVISGLHRIIPQLVMRARFENPFGRPTSILCILECLLVILGHVSCGSFGSNSVDNSFVCWDYKNRVFGIANLLPKYYKVSCIPYKNVWGMPWNPMIAFFRSIMTLTLDSVFDKRICTNIDNLCVSFQVMSILIDDVVNFLLHEQLESYCLVHSSNSCIGLCGIAARSSLLSDLDNIASLLLSNILLPTLKIIIAVSIGQSVDTLLASIPSGGVRSPCIDIIALYGCLENMRNRCLTSLEDNRFNILTSHCLRLMAATIRVDLRRIVNNRDSSLNPKLECIPSLLLQLIDQDTLNVLNCCDVLLVIHIVNDYFSGVSKRGNYVPAKSVSMPSVTDSVSSEILKKLPAEAGSLTDADSGLPKRQLYKSWCSIEPIVKKAVVIFANSHETDTQVALLSFMRLVVECGIYTDHEFTQHVVDRLSDVSYISRTPVLFASLLEFASAIFIAFSEKVGEPTSIISLQSDSWLITTINRALVVGVSVPERVLYAMGPALVLAFIGLRPLYGSLQNVDRFVVINNAIIAAATSIEDENSSIGAFRKRLIAVALSYATSKESMQLMTWALRFVSRCRPMAIWSRLSVVVSTTVIPLTISIKSKRPGVNLDDVDVMTRLFASFCHSDVSLPYVIEALICYYRRFQHHFVIDKEISFDEHRELNLWIRSCIPFLEIISKCNDDDLKRIDQLVGTGSIDVSGLQPAWRGCHQFISNFLIGTLTLAEVLCISNYKLSFSPREVSPHGDHLFHLLRTTTTVLTRQWSQNDCSVSSYDAWQRSMSNDRSTVLLFSKILLEFSTKESLIYHIVNCGSDIALIAAFHLLCLINKYFPNLNPSSATLPSIAVLPRLYELCARIGGWRCRVVQSYLAHICCELSLNTLNHVLFPYNHSLDNISFEIRTFQFLVSNIQYDHVAKCFSEWAMYSYRNRVRSSAEVAHTEKLPLIHSVVSSMTELLCHPTSGIIPFTECLTTSYYMPCLNLILSCINAIALSPPSLTTLELLLFGFGKYIYNPVLSLCERLIITSLRSMINSGQLQSLWVDEWVGIGSSPARWGAVYDRMTDFQNSHGTSRLKSLLETLKFSLEQVVGPLGPATDVAVNKSDDIIEIIELKILKNESNFQTNTFSRNIHQFVLSGSVSLWTRIIASWTKYEEHLICMTDCKSWNGHIWDSTIMCNCIIVSVDRHEIYEMICSFLFKTLHSWTEHLLQINVSFKNMWLLFRMVSPLWCILQTRLCDISFVQHPDNVGIISDLILFANILLQHLVKLYDADVFHGSTATLVLEVCEVSLNFVCLLFSNLIYDSILDIPKIQVSIYSVATSIEMLISIFHPSGPDSSIIAISSRNSVLNLAEKCRRRLDEDLSLFCYDDHVVFKSSSNPYDQPSPMNAGHGFRFCKSGGIRSSLWKCCIAIVRCDLAAIYSPLLSARNVETAAASERKCLSRTSVWNPLYTDHTPVEDLSSLESPSLFLFDISVINVRLVSSIIGHFGFATVAQIQEIFYILWALLSNTEVATSGNFFEAESNGYLNVDKRIRLILNTLTFLLTSGARREISMKFDSQLSLSGRLPSGLKRSILVSDRSLELPRFRALVDEVYDSIPVCSSLYSYQRQMYARDSSRRESIPWYIYSLDTASTGRSTEALWGEASVDTLRTTDAAFRSSIELSELFKLLLKYVSDKLVDESVSATLHDDCIRCLLALSDFADTSDFILMNSIACRELCQCPAAASDADLLKNTSAVSPTMANSTVSCCNPALPVLVKSSLVLKIVPERRFMEDASFAIISRTLCSAFMVSETETSGHSSSLSVSDRCIHLGSRVFALKSLLSGLTSRLSRGVLPSSSIVLPLLFALMRCLTSNAMGFIPAVSLVRRLVISAIFMLIEQFPKEAEEGGFTLSSVLMSQDIFNVEERTLVSRESIFRTVCCGLERLLVSFAVSHSHRDFIASIALRLHKENSVETMLEPSLNRRLLAYELLMAVILTGEERNAPRLSVDEDSLNASISWFTSSVLNPLELQNIEDIETTLTVKTISVVMGTCVSVDEVWVTLVLKLLDNCPTDERDAIRRCVLLHNILTIVFSCVDSARREYLILSGLERILSNEIWPEPLGDWLAQIIFMFGSNDTLVRSAASVFYLPSSIINSDIFSSSGRNVMQLLGSNNRIINLRKKTIGRRSIYWKALWNEICQ